MNQVLDRLAEPAAAARVALILGDVPDGARERLVLLSRFAMQPVEGFTGEAMSRKMDALEVLARVQGLTE
ncbi:MAG: hypothetical protein WBA46_18795 [Thermomicrobiales bacterium]